MFGVLAVMFLSLCLALLLTGLGLKKWRIPLLVWFIPPMLPYLLGAIGTVTGNIFALKALALASEPARLEMASRGMASALYTTAAGLIAALVVLLVQGLGATLACIANKRTDTTTHWGRAIAPLLLCGFIGLILTIWSALTDAASPFHVMAAILLMPAGLGLGLTAWKQLGWESADAASRDAETRLVVTSTLLFVMLVCLTLGHLQGKITALEIVASGAAQARATYMASLAQASSMQAFTWLYGTITIGSAVVVSSIVLSPVSNRLGDSRNGFAFLSLGAILILSFLTQSSLLGWAHRIVASQAALGVVAQ
jgi:hypothetical protein